jgi:hypothetical protein
VAFEQLEPLALTEVPDLQARVTSARQHHAAARLVEDRRKRAIWNRRGRADAALEIERA